MKRVYYTIEKSINENMWILWRNTEGKHTFGSYRVYAGESKKEVQRVLRIIKLVNNVMKKGVIGI